MGSKSNQIFCQDIIQIFYKDDPLQFLFDLEQISFKYYVMSSTANSIIMSCYLEQDLETKYLKEIRRWKIYNFNGKKMFTKSICDTLGNII